MGCHDNPEAIDPVATAQQPFHSIA